MSFNWFDIVLIVIIGIAVIVGVIKGLIRQVIGIAAVVIGLILAMNFYDEVAVVFSSFIRSRILSNLLGFLAIFFGLIIVGGLVSWMLSKLMRGPLRFVNHVLGAALGLVEGILICGVLVLAQLLFPVDWPAMEDSTLAPYCARMTRVVYSMVPQELKDQFNTTYDRIVHGGEENEGI